LEPEREPAAHGSAAVRGQPHDVPDATDRVDEPRAILVDLAPERGDVRLDDPLAPDVVPDVIEDLALGQHPARVQHEEPEELELGRREHDRLAAAPDL